MTHELVIGNVTDSIANIAKLMKDFNIGFVPIAKDKQIVGVITDRDLVINALSNKVKSDDNIEEYMSVNLITINVNSSIKEALDLIGYKKVKRLIVEDDKKVVGIISISDLIKAADIDKECLITNLRKLLEIYRSNDYKQADIDEFYL